MMMLHSLHPADLHPTEDNRSGEMYEHLRCVRKKAVFPQMSQNLLLHCSSL